MKEKIFLSMLFSILFFSLVIPLTNAQLDNKSCSMIENEKASFVGTKIPEQVSYSDEVFNIYIEEEIFGHFTISESTISDFGCVENKNATYNIIIKDSSTIEDLMKNFSVESLNSKLSSGEIEIKGITVGKKIKLFFTKIGLKFLNWFS